MSHILIESNKRLLFTFVGFALLILLILAVPRPINTSLGRISQIEGERYSKLVRWGNNFLAGNLQAGRMFLVAQEGLFVEEVLSLGQSLADFDVTTDGKINVVSSSAEGSVRYRSYKPDFTLQEDRYLDISEINKLTLESNPRLQLNQEQLIVNGNLLFSLGTFESEVEGFIQYLNDNDTFQLGKHLFEHNLLGSGHCYRVEFKEKFMVAIVSCSGKEKVASFDMDYPISTENESLGPWNLRPIDYDAGNTLFLLERKSMESNEKEQNLFVSSVSGKLTKLALPEGEFATGLLYGEGFVAVMVVNDELRIVWEKAAL